MAILSNINDKFAVDSTGAIQFNGQAGTSGYVLKSNGNAAPTWVDASTVIGGPYLPLSGGTLTGATATASGISFTVGGVLNGTSATFSGNVRISKTDATLEINNSTGSLTNADLYISVEDTGQADVRQYGAYPLAFWTNNAERMRIDSSGNLSLATATSLDFNVADFAQIKFKESGAITIDSDNNQSSRNFQFKDGDGSSLMFIGDNGNVGIGETSPNAKLDVPGNVKLGSAAHSSWTDAKQDVGGLDVFVGSGSNAFQVWDDNQQTYPRFKVERAGNVGIGTTGPQSKLQVGTRGTASALSLALTDGILFDFYNESSPYKRHGVIISQAADASESVLDFNTKAASGTNSTKMTILGNGNVGIGTTDPDEKLVLYKPIGYSSDSALYSAYAVNSTAVDNNNVFKWRTGITGNQSGHNLTFSTLARTESSYVERMRIDNSGNVGIGNEGTSIVVTGKGLGIQNIGQDTIASMRLTGHNATGNPGVATYTELKHYGADLKFGINHNGGTDVITINPSKNVGIGTISPKTNLEVIGGLNISTNTTSATTTTMRIGSYGESSQTYYGAKLVAHTNFTSTANTDLSFDLGSLGEVMRLHCSGSEKRVGIGTTSPSGPFHVKVGTSTPLIVASNSYCNNVGIRTTTPTASLQVKGNVSYSYNNYTNVANTWINVINFSGYPAGLYQISIIKQTNASTYITAIVKWSATAGTVISTIASNQLGITFSGTQLQAISGIATGTLMSANLQCLVTNENFCS